MFKTLRGVEERQLNDNGRSFVGETLQLEGDLRSAGSLDVAGLIKEDFLQQNGYSDYDQFCPIWKTEWMMKAMMGFHDEAQKAIAQGGNWNKVREATGEIQSQLRSMKFEVPGDGEDVIVKKVRFAHSCVLINTDKK